MRAPRSPISAAPSDIASPGLIGSLVLLSLFPLIGKLAADWLRRQRVYKGWRRPRRYDRNLVVIGAGAGGLVTAYIAAAVRAKVTLIEANRMGGDCLNTGCVPSKSLIRSARAAHEIRHADRFGLAAQAPEVDFPAVMRRIRDIIAEIAPADSVERYTGLGVDVRIGHARIVDPWTVEVDGERLTTRAIVIAAGGEPVIPDIPGLAESGYLTSDTMWDALGTRAALPQRLVILGGGPIGVEMAQAFARLGSKVTLVQSGERILPREDADAAAVVAETLTGEGVDIRTGHKAVRCEGKALVVSAGGEETALPFDDLIVAVGRKPRLNGLRPRGARHRHRPPARDQCLAGDALPEHLRGRRRRRALSVHPRRVASGLACGGQRLVRPVQALPRRLWRAALGHLHRSRGRPCRP